MRALILISFLLLFGVYSFANDTTSSQLLVSVTESYKGKPHKNIEVFFYDTLTNDTIIQVTDSNGYVAFDVVEDRFYKLFANGFEAEDYIVGGDEIVISTYDKQLPFSLYVNLIMRKHDGCILTIVYEDVFFKKNSVEPDSGFEELTEAASWGIKESPNIVLELISYAACNENNPMQIAEQRCLFIFNYLVSLGYKAGNISCDLEGINNGFNMCNCERYSCSEEEHSLNRRVQFKILEI